MDSLTLLLILAMLAAWRVSYDLARMDGPALIYARLRGWAIERFGDGHWVAEGLSCPICVSFWASLPVAVVWAVAAGLLLWLPIVWMGIAGAVLLLVLITRR